MEPKFEPMSIGRILDQAFRIYKSRFIRFIAIIAVIQIPISLIRVLTQTLLIQQEYSDEGVSINIVLAGSSNLLMVFLMMLGQTLCSGALTRSVAETYLGRDMSVGQAYGHVLPKFLTLILASVLVSICVGFGFLLLVVPGVIFSLWFALTTPAIIMEDLGATPGMSRSRTLVKGNLGKVFAVGFLAFVLMLVITLPFGFAGTFLNRVVAQDNQTIAVLISQLCETLGQLITTPIGAITSILLYYDLRIRKEGFDLQMMIESMDVPQTNAE